MRERSVLVNIMRDFPRQDTQPEKHAILLLCMFKPIFDVRDLRRPVDKSWSDALQRTETANEWDPRSFTMRSNIRAMLTQRLAADEETARRREELFAARERGERDGDVINGDIFNMACDDDDTTGTNVLPPSRNAHGVSAYVNEAVDSLLEAGFSRSDIARTPSSSLLSGRDPRLVAADLDRVRHGDNVVDAADFMKEFGVKLAKCDANTTAATPEETQPVHTPGPYMAAAMEPYLRELRGRSEAGLTDDAKAKMSQRRQATNERVAETDVGRASVYQHEAVQRIAQEFGLNRKQRLAFFIFGNAWMARNGSPNPDALRLHVSGGAGSGKSYVLKAIVTLIECPALEGFVPPGGLLCVAYQVCSALVFTFMVVTLYRTQNPLCSRIA